MSVRLSILLFLVASHCSGVLINGTAASVGKVLITLEDARFYSAVHRVKEGHQDPLRMEEGEELKRTVQKMIFEEMVSVDMGGSHADTKIRGIAERLLVKSKKGQEAALIRIVQQFGKNREQAIHVIWKSLSVERLVQKKVETMTPIITDAEVRQYLQQNPGKFKEEDLDGLKPNVVLLLKKRRVEGQLEEWIHLLKEKYRAQNFLEG